jgi:hypothetical protein
MICKECLFCKLVDNDDSTSNHLCSNPENIKLHHGFIIDKYIINNSKPKTCNVENKND